MGRQRKNLIIMIACLALLGALAGIYFWRRSAAEAAELEALSQPAEETVNLTVIDQPDKEVAQIEYINEHGSIKLAQRPVSGGDAEEKEWYLVDYPDVIINQSVCSSMSYFASSFSARSLVLETLDNRAEYGLDPGARAVATYTDGSTQVVHVGSPTPDRSNYYMAVEGNPALYLLTSGVGERFYFTYGDLVDRTIPEINPEAYDYLMISDREGSTMEFDFIGTQEEREEMLETAGALTLTMIQPHYGRELYNSSLSYHLFENLPALTLGELVEIEANDLSPYGLDEPSMEFWYKSGESEIHLLLGDKTEDGNIYAMLSGRKQVFLMAYESVALMYGLNPQDMVDKFIALVNIDNCNTITVDHTDPAMDYELVVNNEVLPPEEGEEQGEKIIKPVINGAAVDDELFRDAYRTAIGFGAVKIEDNPRPDTEPVFTFTYALNDGSEDIVLYFYDYDANFYSVWRDGIELENVTDRQNVNLFFGVIERMLAGETAE